MPRSAFALLCLLMPLAAARVHADTVVVSADRMLDVVPGPAVEHPYIVITDGRISSISSKDTAVPPAARHIDLPGITLLP
jgi:imidazolonepropionase-like amidohydrolase